MNLTYQSSRYEDACEDRQLLRNWWWRQPGTLHNDERWASDSRPFYRSSFYLLGLHKLHNSTRQDNINRTLPVWLEGKRRQLCIAILPVNHSSLKHVPSHSSDAPGSRTSATTSKPSSSLWYGLCVSGLLYLLQYNCHVYSLSVRP